MRQPSDYRYLGFYSQRWGWDHAQLCAGDDAPLWYPNLPWSMTEERAHGLVAQFDHTKDLPIIGYHHPLEDVSIVLDRWDEVWDEVLDFHDFDLEVRDAA